ncbi:amidohydrolase [Brevibacterium casei]
MRLFSNAVVRTLAPAEEAPTTPPDAILVDGETIVAVGARDELLDIAAAQTSSTAALASAGGVGATSVIPGAAVEEIDCAGRVILPGIVDAHMHSVAYADSLTNLDLSGTRSLAEAVAAIRERARTLPVGSWVVGAGWDLNRWEDPRYPDRELLDREVPDHPVAMWSIDLHTVWANGHALEIAGIDADTPDPSGGEIVRDTAGVATGLIREDAADLLVRYIPEPSREDQAERLERTQELFLSLGITGIHDFDGIASTLGWNDLREAGRQRLRVTKFLRQPEVPWAIETGWMTGGGDDWLQHGGVKLFADGALGSHTSHMSSPYPEPEPAGVGVHGAEAPESVEATVGAETAAVALDVPPEAHLNYGIAQMSEDELFEQARIATEAGISVAIHAIGDQANHHVLNVFERLRPVTLEVSERLGRPLRHRVEHAQFIQPEDVARFAELDVIASMQPRHCISDLHLLHLIDESAQLAAYAWPDLLGAGAQVIFGSDGPVEHANPFAAIYAAMTRADIFGNAGSTFQPQRRLSAVEAFRLHSRAPAVAAGLGDRRGHLAAGMDADFIVVDTDPCEAEGLVVAEAVAGPDGLLGYDSEEALFAHAEAIRDTRVFLTVVGGEVQYAAE